MNKELKEALELLEKERNISKSSLLEAIENSLISACKNHFGVADNVKVSINPDTCDYSVFQEKEVVDSLEDLSAEEKPLKISLEDAKKMDIKYEVGDKVLIPIKSTEFGRIATGRAKSVILQKIREEERKAIYNDYYSKEREVISGVVQRYVGKNMTVNLGRCDAMLPEAEQVKSEQLKPTDRIKVYVVEVKENPKGPKITVSRNHQELVRKLFESEVSEIKDGIVEIKSIAREAGSRTKMAVSSNDENVDAVGACVGINGIRVNSVVEELRGEKVDIINWDDNPGYLIENALSPAKVICVVAGVADEDNKEAQVIVPDYQLSLAIGKEGQNARLAAKLTGYKIDIKSETQAREIGLFDELGIDYRPEGTLDFEEIEVEPEITDPQEETGEVIEEKGENSDI